MDFSTGKKLSGASFQSFKDKLLARIVPCLHLQFLLGEYCRIKHYFRACRDFRLYYIICTLLLKNLFEDVYINITD